MWLVCTRAPGKFHRDKYLYGVPRRPRSALCSTQTADASVVINSFSNASSLQSTAIAAQREGDQHTLFFVPTLARSSHTRHVTRRPTSRLHRVINNPTRAVDGVESERNLLAGSKQFTYLHRLSADNGTLWKGRYQDGTSELRPGSRSVCCRSISNDDNYALHYEWKTPYRFS